MIGRLDELAAHAGTAVRLKHDQIGDVSVVAILLDDLFRINTAQDADERNDLAVRFTTRIVPSDILHSDSK